VYPDVARNNKTQQAGSKGRGRPKAGPRMVLAEARVFHALRRQPSQARGLQRITDVLDACERLLKGRRFDEITIEDIAQAADIQIGSLYHFFQDKIAVLVSVLERALLAEADAFRPLPDDRGLSLADYLQALEDRLRALWRPRTALLDLYFAYQHHPLVWASTLKLRARVARDIAAKLRQLYPRMPARTATAAGEQIGIVLAVLNDNLAFVGAGEQRRLRRECLEMLEAYVGGKARA